ncbi:hypothetical protein BU24DRAFT_416649 [Aaosphaeria arxii CBS 175.79]|uniref:Uncharacterized protein n=1 Tax=Aaosphaeria arxii CBS 175.79 TaxID=1450172 RepID=A0A6A5Y5Z0_9PLEO|nr:uncharacterized protein BU24DRAFT_416649 [Aaosphaeria arxii CBS 175.79]KAF2020975.1 hypothetical protein BU24DRAFT_416649 [Aaosphaeria arxii CBS 175.79]
MRCASLASILLSVLAVSIDAAPQPEHSVKRKAGDPCPKPGVVWCQDNLVHTCSDVFRIETPGMTCAQKEKREIEKRKVNDPCDKINVSWCQDNQVLFCWQVPERQYGLIRPTGLTCDQ